MTNGRQPFTVIDFGAPTADTIRQASFSASPMYSPITIPAMTAVHTAAIRRRVRMSRSATILRPIPHGRAVTGISIAEAAVFLWIPVCPTAAIPMGAGNTTALHSTAVPMPARPAAAVRMSTVITPPQPSMVSTVLRNTVYEAIVPPVARISALPPTQVTASVMARGAIIQAHSTAV